METPSRVFSLYVSDALLKRIEAKRDELSQGEMKRRPSRSSVITHLVEKALGDSR